MHEWTCLIGTTVFYASVYKLMAEVLPNGYLETFQLAGFPKKVKCTFCCPNVCCSPAIHRAKRNQDPSYRSLSSIR